MVSLLAGESKDEGVGVSSQACVQKTEQPEAGGLVSSPAPLPLQTLSKVSHSWHMISQLCECSTCG